MKTIAAIAFLGTTLAMRLSDEEYSIVDMVRDIPVAYFGEGDLTCIGEAVRAGLIEEGVGPEDVKAIARDFKGELDVEEATIGDGIDYLLALAEQAEYTPEEADAVLEVMFTRAHACSKIKAEREARTQQEGEVGDDQGDEEIAELLEMRKDEIPEEGLQCLG